MADAVTWHINVTDTGNFTLSFTGEYHGSLAWSIPLDLPEILKPLLLRQFLHYLRHQFPDSLSLLSPSERLWPYLLVSFIADGSGKQASPFSFFSSLFLLE